MKREVDLAEDLDGVRTVEDLAERQDGVVGLEDAFRLGVSRGQVGRRRRTGRYRRCRRGVVQIAGVPPSWRQSVRIASIAAGEKVVVSHGSAARLYGVEIPRATHRRWKRDGQFIEVSAQLVRHVRLAGVRGHRSGMWSDGDVEQHAGMAVTSPIRVVIDMSSRLGPRGTGKLLDEFLRKRLIDLEAFRHRVVELRPAPGRSVRILRAVAAARAPGFDPGESTLESRLRLVIARKRFPPPVGQHWVRDGPFNVRLDFAYPDLRLYLEGDGFGFHRLASDLDDDVRKRNGLLARGWIGLHFTWRMTDEEIEQNLARFYDRTSRTWHLPR